MASGSPVTVALKLDFFLSMARWRCRLADPSHFNGDDGGHADAYQGYESDGTPVHDTPEKAGRSEQWSARPLPRFGFNLVKEEVVGSVA
jgi:hypothetical protein